MILIRGIFNRVRRAFSRPSGSDPIESPQHTRARFESETFGRQGGYG
jgi:hypothetical protein